MKCPYCGAETPETSPLCASCGQPLHKDQSEPLEPPFLQEEPAPEAEPAAQKKAPLSLILTISLVAIALVVVVLILIRQAIPAAQTTNDTTPESTPLTGEFITPEAATSATPRYEVAAYTSPALVPDGAMDTVIGSFGSTPVDNRTLNYYYWGELNYLSNYYGSALSQWLDLSRPLGEQAYNGMSDFTWQDALLESAASSITETYALVTQAEETGFVLSESDSAYLAQLSEQLPEIASQAGYSDVDAYLQSAYGTGADQESFLAFMEASLIASAYATEVYNSFHYTDDEISAYYEAGGYADNGLEQDDARNIDVRHILLQTRTDEDGNLDWDQTLAEAEQILAMWETSPTEEHFAALADEYSEDPGSNANGGLYTDVAQGQMVQSFNDWCFDQARQSGDTGIVKTDYGYHIMYFVAHADRPAWMDTVEDDMRHEAYSNAVASWVAEGGFEPDYTAVVLSPPVGLYE